MNYIKTTATFWVDLIEDLMRTYQTPPTSLRYLVKYEDLRENTLEELKKIYEFLDIDIKKQELEDIVTKYDFKNIPTDQKGAGKFYRSATPGGWKNNFNDEEKELMNSIMGDTLKKLNYSID